MLLLIILALLGVILLALQSIYKNLELSILGIIIIGFDLLILLFLVKTRDTNLIQLKKDIYAAQITVNLLNDNTDTTLSFQDKYLIYQHFTEINNQINSQKEASHNIWTGLILYSDSERKYLDTVQYISFDFKK